MSRVFDGYAYYYDLLYKDKDYAAEAQYIDSLIRQHAPLARRILELGCGTGAHAAFLASMGYTVHGIDVSDAMIAKAEDRKATLPTEIAERLSFDVGDVRTARINETYDAVISLFHVASYQTENNDLTALFETASRHLRSLGVFLFDFWYGPAVLMQKPEVRLKRLEGDEIKVLRIAEPVMHLNQNVVDVNYTVLIEQKNSGQVEQIKETHKMRYLFLPELLCYSAKDFHVRATHAWMNDEPLNEQAWSGIQILIRA
jgi:SAM-dependent methyltransferase